MCGAEGRGEGENEGKREAGWASGWVRGHGPVGSLDSLNHPLTLALMAVRSLHPLIPHLVSSLSVCTYMQHLLCRYGGAKLERARDLFEQCLAKCPPDLAPEFFIKVCLSVASGGAGLCGVVWGLLMNGRS